ncbi:hypothetical protein [Candidatus Rariloculus sp.]|uniref:hypothetical protein n=1 Tax=Candidatus Rariloculus sp. TaxID=3101265 RepID=UPI003D12B8A4
MNPRSMLVSVAVPLALLAAAAGHAQTDRTPWGDPDLQGLWSNATLTPLQRPDALGDKAFFTPEEAQAYVAERIEATNADNTIRQEGAVGSYNDAWFDRGNSIVPTLRTSLVIDPANGKVPPFMPEAQLQHEANLAYAQEHPSDSPADRFLTERCIVFGGGAAPLFPEPYNNNYYIVQTPDYVTIMAEINHEVRIIPIDGRPGFPERVLQWTGDSRGHWEDDTLVVETRNQRTNRHFYGVQMLNSVMSDEFRVIERFTRTAPDQIRYQTTIDDPAVFTAPWTAEIFMHPQEGPLVEYACHEGNYGMSGLLSAAREEERRAAETQ